MIKHTHLPAGFRWLVGSLSLLVAAACSGGASSATSSRSMTTSASPTEPNVTSMVGAVLGRGTHPGFVVEAPLDWSSNGYFVTDSGGGSVLGVSVWDVGKVARNPCHSIGNLVVPCPTVDDLVAALEAQSMRHADRADRRDARRLLRGSTSNGPCRRTGSLPETATSPDATSRGTDTGTS